jgi:hypothetical protein
MLLKHKSEISSRILNLPEAYRLQLQHLLDHLLNIDKRDYKINHRESYLFTNPMQNEDDNNCNFLTDNNLNEALIHNEVESFENGDTKASIHCESKVLRKTANPQQKFLLDFVQSYLDHLIEHSRRPVQVIKPKPFHIVVNGLAGSGKSYVISIIEKMLNEYCIAESASVSFGRKNFGLLKMAHTGKAALNIRGSTIHSALEIVKNFLIHILRIIYILF